ncbi:MAG: RNA polymerase sigma factor [Candidatus Omnitrophota bacterium]
MTAISQALRKLEKIVAANTDECADIESEKTLVEHAKTSAAAFGQLYEIHYSAILNYIYRRTLNKNAAEELTSNTFFNALNALPKYHHKAPFRAWLYRIALNELRMFFRKEKRRRTTEQTFLWKEDIERIYFHGLNVEEREASMKQYAHLHREISNLPMRYQEVIAFRFFENLEYFEISQILGKRMGTVKSLIHRGLKRLRKQMEKQDATFFENRH